MIEQDDLIIAIYRSGKIARVDMSAGDLRSIGQQLVAMADNVMIRGTMPEEEEQANDRSD